MKSASFESTPAFKHFRDVMRGVIAVPKVELDKKLADYEQEKKKRSVVRKRRASKP